MSTGTVLVIEDDPAITALMEEILQEQGYSVLTSAAVEAVQVAQDRQPAVILLDLMMPVLDGNAVSRLLRANPLTQHIPIVVSSVRSPWEADLSALPVNDWLRKPFHYGDLVGVVARWMASHTRSGVTGSSTASVRAETVPPPR